MTETITITSLIKDSDDTYTDFVTAVKFNLRLEKNGSSASKDFEILIASPYLFEDYTFTPYSDITEENVISWIKSSPEYVSKIGDLDFQLWRDSQTEDTDLPWQT